MVYDCFTFFNELDLLEIRLNILDPYVDFFVLCEADETFSRKPKPYFYEENKERFAKWNHKIIRVVPPRKFMAMNSFERAAYQKDYIRTALTNCQPEDIIYYGDLDEIWKSQEVGDEIYKLRQINYSYYLNMRSSEDWQGTNVFRYKNIKDLNEIRADHSHVLEDGGWHFTNMGGHEQILKKLDAYDHQEYNIDDVKEKLKERMENGEDYVGRQFDWQGNSFEFWEDEVDLPQYLLDNKEKWKNLFQ